jgi:hypothetical protein
MVQRSYTAEQRAEAVALSASVGPLKAAKQLGIPARTVASWGHRQESSAIIRAAHQDIAESLRFAHAETLDSVMRGVRDPKSRLGERAAALRVLGEQLALAEGRATSNVAMQAHVEDETAGPPLTAEEEAELSAFLQQVIESHEQAERAQVQPTVMSDADKE